MLMLILMELKLDHYQKVTATSAYYLQRTNIKIVFFKDNHQLTPLSMALLIGKTFFAATTMSFSYRYMCRAKLFISSGSKSSF